MIKVLHTADWHIRSKDALECLKSINQVIDYVKTHKIALVVIAGDLFDEPVVLEEYPQSPLTPALEKLIELAEYCPINIVEGNPPHDKIGSLEILSKLHTKYPIQVTTRVSHDSLVYFNPIKKFFKRLPIGHSIRDYMKYATEEAMILYNLPWPLKQRFLSSEELQLPLKEVDMLYMRHFNKWVEDREHLFKSLKNRCPFMLVAHLQLEGAKTIFGHELTSQFHTPKMFQRMCHYGALGHIHLKQSHGLLHYSGSIHHVSWGEIEAKYFNVVTFSFKDSHIHTSVSHVRLNTIPMVKLNIKGDDEYNALQKSFEKYRNNYSFETIKVWVNVENISTKSLVNPKALKKYFANNNAVLDKLTVSDMSIKSTRLETSNEEFSLNLKSQNQSLIDKFKQWCTMNNETCNKFQLRALTEAEMEATK